MLDKNNSHFWHSDQHINRHGKPVAQLQDAMPKFLGPFNCFDSEGWLSCDQLTFYVFHVFLVKGMQHLSEKMQFPGFLFSQVVQTH